ncbi:MAG TPA: nucleotidyltransferase [Thermoanaerobaculia bacterium]
MKSRDYEEFIESLNRNGAEFLIVGAHAVAFHARPRATKDLDLYIAPTPENAERVLQAIRDFLGTDLGINAVDLSTPGRIVQLGVAPTRIDLMPRLAGIASFRAAWSRRVDAVFGDVPAHYIALDDLIRAKTSSGREQDKADVKVLRRVVSRPRRRR